MLMVCPFGSARKRDRGTRSSCRGRTERGEAEQSDDPGPICGRPPACKRSSRRDRIACDHMYGLLSRSHMTAAKMGSATRAPNRNATLKGQATGSHGLSRVGDRNDHAICLSRASFGLQRMVLNQPPKLGIGSRTGLGHVGHLRMVKAQGFVLPTAAQWRQAQSAVRAGRRPPPKAARSGLDGACAALQCRSAGRSRVSRAAGHNARR